MARGADEGFPMPEKTEGMDSQQQAVYEHDRAVTEALKLLIGAMDLQQREEILRDLLTDLMQKGLKSLSAEGFNEFKALAPDLVKSLTEVAKVTGRFKTDGGV